MASISPASIRSVRCLAGAVGTEQREDFARRQLKRNVIDGDARVEATRQM